MPPSADAFWLALRRVHGVGPRTCRVLIDKFETPEKIFAATAAELTQAGISSRVARAIADYRDFDSLERELCELPRFSARLVRWTDADYPPNLRQIADPPPYLFVRGDAPLADPHCIAVVGARAASEAGLRMAERLGFELAAKGFTVVSGLARGIDGAAHQGALGAGGRTIAAMGCGIDIVYPPEHRQLADSILAQGGALITELPVGTQPLGENFPARNRILSGLCLGVVIVEAAERSGSLITARMALEQNRQVFAVPGSPLSGKARGSNRLLKDGALLVDCVEDVIEELAPQLEGQVSKPIGTSRGASAKTATTSKPAESDLPRRMGDLGVDLLDKAKVVITTLNDDQKLHVDAIIEASGLDAQTVLRLLLEMELRGIVAQHPGKLFSLA
ncbi:MAG: DNA-processing protein DprA [Candidatus Binataceae bacterium]